MEIKQLKHINLSTKIMDENQISSYIDNKISSFIEEIHQQLNYTAFEVFPTNAIIPAGSKDTNDKTDPTSVAAIFDFDNTTATNLPYTIEVPANMVFDFQILYGCYSREKSDVVIDFGDNTTFKLKDMTVEAETINGLYRSEIDEGTIDDRVIHTYTVPGKYIVKIYGRSLIQCSPKRTCANENYNIVSRIWTNDMPFTVECPTSIASKTLKLLKVNVTKGVDLRKIKRLVNTFSQDHNLLEFQMSEFANNSLHDLDHMFVFLIQCENLDHSKLKFFVPSTVSEFGALIGPSGNCKDFDFINILAPNGYGTFCECGSLTFKDAITDLSCSDFDLLGKYFWNSTTYWSNKKYKGQDQGLISRAFASTPRKFRENVSYVFGGFSPIYNGKNIYDGSMKNVVVGNGDLYLAKTITNDIADFGIGSKTDYVIAGFDKSGNGESFLDEDCQLDQLNQYIKSFIATPFEPVYDEITEYTITVQNGEGVVVDVKKFGTANVVIAWGDGKTTTATSTTYSKEYAAAGTYKITVTNGSMTYLNKLAFVRILKNNGNPVKSSNAKWIVASKDAKENVTSIPLQYINGGYIDQQFNYTNTSRAITTIGDGTGTFFISNLANKDAIFTFKAAATITFDTDIDLTKETDNTQTIADINTAIQDNKSKSKDTGMRLYKRIGYLNAEDQHDDSELIYRLGTNYTTNNESLCYGGYKLKGNGFVYTSNRKPATIKSGTGKILFKDTTLSTKPITISINGGVDITLINDASELESSTYQSDIFDVIKTKATSIITKVKVTYTTNNKYKIEIV